MKFELTIEPVISATFEAKDPHEAIRRAEEIIENQLCCYLSNYGVDVDANISLDYSIATMVPS